MNNCLVTKLNGSVHNDTLPLLGYQQFAFSLSDRGKSEGIQLNSSSVKPIRLIGDGYFINENNESLGKETVQDINGIYMNTPGSFLINIPNNFREGEDVRVILGQGRYENLVMEETSVEKLLKIVGTSTSAKFYPSFSIKTKALFGDVTKLLNLWGNGSFELVITEESNNAYGNLDDVVLHGESSNSLWGYYFTINNMPRLTGNLETLLNKFAQHIGYTSTPEDHDMYFTLWNCPLVKYKGESIGDYFRKTFTMKTNNTWIEKQGN